MTQVGWSGLTGAADPPLPSISTIAAIMRAGYGWLPALANGAAVLAKNKRNFGLGPPFKTGTADQKDRPGTDVSRLSDAELIQQLADQAKQLGVKIDLSYDFGQQQKPDEEPQEAIDGADDSGDKR